MHLLSPENSSPARVQECPLGFSIEIFSLLRPQKKSSGFPDLRPVPPPYAWTSFWGYISEPLTNVLGLLRWSEQWGANSFKAKPENGFSLSPMQQTLCCCWWQGLGGGRAGNVYITISINWPHVQWRYGTAPLHRWKVWDSKRWNDLSISFLHISPLNSNCSLRPRSSISYCVRRPLLTPLSRADHSFRCQPVATPFVISWVKFSVWCQLNQLHLLRPYPGSHHYRGKTASKAQDKKMIGHCHFLKNPVTQVYYRKN